MYMYDDSFNVKKKKKKKVVVYLSRLLYNYVCPFNGNGCLLLLWRTAVKVLLYIYGLYC